MNTYFIFEENNIYQYQKRLRQLQTIFNYIEKNIIFLQEFDPSELDFFFELKEKMVFFKNLLQKMKLLNRKFRQNVRMEDFLEINQQQYLLFCRVIKIKKRDLIALDSHPLRKPSVKSAKESIKAFFKIVDLLTDWSN